MVARTIASGCGQLWADDTHLMVGDMFEFPWRADVTEGEDPFDEVCGTGQQCQPGEGIHGDPGRFDVEQIAIGNPTRRLSTMSAVNAVRDLPATPVAEAVPIAGFRSTSSGVPQPP